MNNTTRFVLATLLFVILAILVMVGDTGNAEAQGGSGVLCVPTRCVGAYQYYSCTDGIYSWQTSHYSSACLYNSFRYVDSVYGAYANRGW